jgi:prepilin-type N-terminal cleavage/methylation domain-containing protein
MRVFEQKAFTLIELLIVVAIIAILAAIAVPNFLEAQTRSKVSRAKSDMRTVGLGMEAYRVDNNKFPPWNGTNLGGRWTYGSPGVFRYLTTPIAYVTGSVFYDTFMREKSEALGYIFYALSMPDVSPKWGDRTAPGEQKIKDWGIRSYGPDKDDDASTGNRAYAIIIYDPSNGTVSDGDVWRIDNAEATGKQFRDN